MDKIAKALLGMSEKERDAVNLLMKQLEENYHVIPGIKPLTGVKGLFRVRVGQYRIIFRVDPKTDKAGVKRIARRSEKTYKDL